MTCGIVGKHFSECLWILRQLGSSFLCSTQLFGGWQQCANGLGWQKGWVREERRLFWCAPRHLWPRYNVSSRQETHMSQREVRVKPVLSDGSGDWGLWIWGLGLDQSRNFGSCLVPLGQIPVFNSQSAISNSRNVWHELNVAVFTIPVVWSRPKLCHELQDYVRVSNCLRIVKCTRSFHSCRHVDCVWDIVNYIVIYEIESVFWHHQW